jgi:hypothetical protein
MRQGKGSKLIALLLIFLAVCSCISKGSKVYNSSFIPTQEFKFDPKLLQCLTFGEKEMHALLDLAYQTDNNYAGFSSKLLTYNYREECSWEDVFSLELFRNYYRVGVQEKDHQKIINAVEASNYDYSGLSIQRIYQLTLLKSILDQADFDIQNSIETFFDEEHNLYTYGDNDNSYIRMLSATYFALATYELLGLESPHIKQIKNVLSQSEVFEALTSEKGSDYFYWIILCNNLNVDLNESCSDWAMQYNKDLEATTFDSLQVFTVNLLNKVNAILEIENTHLINYVNKYKDHFFFGDIMASRELTIAFIELQESIKEKLIIFENEQLGFLIDHIKSLYKTNLAVGIDNFNPNPMDTYYGIRLANYYGYKYDKTKTKNYIEDFNEEFISSADSTDYSFFIFLYFNILSHKEMDLPMSNAKKTMIIDLCLNELFNNAWQDPEQYYGQVLENTLFIVETLKILDYNFTISNIKDIETRILTLCNNNAVHETFYVSEVQLLCDMLGLDILPNLEMTIPQLYVGGGFTSMINEPDYAHINPTARVLRFEKNMNSVDIDQLERFINSFLINGELTYDIDEHGADLRLYYNYIRLMHLIERGSDND